MPAPATCPSTTLRERALPGRVAALLRRDGVPGVSALQSGLDLDGLGRWSYVCLRPRAVAWAEPGEELTLREGPAGLPERWGGGDPLRGAAELLASLAPPTRGGGAPFSGGGLLTLGYDLGRRYERLPAGPPPVGAPDLHLSVHDGALAFDHERGEATWVGADVPAAAEALAALERARALADEPAPPSRSPRAPAGLSLDAAAYRAAVQRARALIRRGDLFQVNLSRRWALPPVDPEACFELLGQLAPAPFMADLALGGGRRLLSASPERFLALDPAGRASSWPIKGTRPRGQDPARDAALREELLASPKEAAELAMIVDLVRNDLGRVARPGSVRVRDPRLVQSWPTVHHTVAWVEAELESGRDWAELVRAAFPPGSVTGAPKLRAMEVIDELEPVRRGLYCGAFGWVGWDGALDLAVAIRVLPLDAAGAAVHAGGAVTLDSEPGAEERETLAKARALLDAAGRSAARA